MMQNLVDLPQSMQMNRYLNRCSCSMSTMYSHLTIYFLHFYRLSWAFERHQLFLWLDVTKIRYVYVLASTQPVLNHSFLLPFFLFLNFIYQYYSGFVLYSMALYCWNVFFELNVTKKCPFIHSSIRKIRFNGLLFLVNAQSIWVSINYLFQFNGLIKLDLKLLRTL